MLTKLFAITLSLSILVLSAGKSFVVLDYVLNKEYISKNLCENRSKPKMHCNGKCHLKKQLQKEEKKENSPMGMKEKAEVQLFHTTCRVSAPHIFENKISYNIPASKKYPAPSLSAVFHPPCS